MMCALGAQVNISTDDIRSYTRRKNWYNQDGEPTNPFKKVQQRMILPILSLDMGAVKFASRNKTDFPISLTLGRCMQLALFVVPLTILIGWWIRVNERSLQFDPFTIVSLYLLPWAF
jgi:hypothetical protein